MFKLFHGSYFCVSLLRVAVYINFVCVWLCASRKPNEGEGTIPYHTIEWWMSGWRTWNYWCMAHGWGCITIVSRGGMVHASGLFNRQTSWRMSIESYVWTVPYHTLPYYNLFFLQDDLKPVVDSGMTHDSSAGWNFWPQWKVCNVM